MSNLVQCPQCLHMNAANSEICEQCGALLCLDDGDPTQATIATGELATDVSDFPEFPAPVTTRRIEPGPEQNEPRWGDARIDERTRLLAHVIHHDRSILLDIHATGSVVLGRQQLDTSAGTKLDLSEFDALEAGVSRQHARFELKDYSLYITDLDSTNGTYLNGLRILPRQPRVVRDGDEVRLGRLKLQILFLHPGETQTQIPADSPAEHSTDDPADNLSDSPAEDPMDDPADSPADNPADSPADSSETGNS